MSGPNVATVWARALIDELVRSGVDQLCLAPGSRSTPLVLAAAGHQGLRTRVFLDERAAAFFALGWGRATGRPAAVLTTSGTAVANLFPAVVEAAQAEVPLLLLTADRPPRLRDADANQTIDQVRFFGAWVRWHADLVPAAGDAPALRHLRGVACRAVAATLGGPPGPVHLNLPFAKPLEPELVARPAETQAETPAERPAEPTIHHAAARPGGEPWVRICARHAHATDDELAALVGTLAASVAPVLVAGPHPAAAELGPVLRRLAGLLGTPLLADPLSGGRYGPAEAGAVIPVRYDLFLREERVRAALAADVVVRVGQAPTSAALLDWLDEQAAATQIVVDAGGRWKDHLARADTYVQADPATTLARVADGLTGGAAPAALPARRGWIERWGRLESAAEAALAPTEAGQGAPHEGHVLAAVLAALPADTPIFVSGSMPVRDLDAFGGARTAAVPVFGNRGASGIDGIVSSALGVAAGTGRPAVAVLGDLALLHDVNGLLAAREPDARVVFVVINNDGGGIFHFLPVREHEPAFTPYFATPHGIEPARAAALYGVPHRLLDGPAGLASALPAALDGPSSVLLEIRTERDENRRGHECAARAVAEAALALLDELADL